MKTISSLSTLLLVASSCAAFPYKYYGIDPEHSKLLGKAPADDLPLENCQADSQQKGKCAVFFVDELERVMTDYVDLQNRLKACEEKR